MNLKRDDILQNFLYGILLSSFLILYFILAINNRPAADDFYFLKNFEVHGWWQSIVISWQSWVTRWASIFFLNGIFSLYLFSGNFLFFHIITLLMLCFAFYRFSSSAIDFGLLHLHSRYRSLHRISELPRYSRFTVLVLITFFFLCADPGETFFWVTSTSMYLWSFIVLCFLFAELMKADQDFTSWILCGLAALFIGGAAEAIAIPAVFILSAFFIFQFRNKSLRYTTILSLVMLVMSLLAGFLGEGRMIRQSALPDVSFLQSILFTGKTLVEIEINFFKDKFLWTFLNFIAWTGLAARIKPGNFFTVGRLVKFAIIYFVLCFILVFPASWLLGDVLPYRAWILVTFLNCICLAVAGIFTGLLLGKPVLLRVISSAALIALAVLIVNTTIAQKKIAGDYSRAVDSRMQFLTTLVDPVDNTTIILENLPASGFLMSSEISTDTADHRNRHLKNYLQLQGNLKVK